eukprot:GHRR01004636.1.p1 GENE.GHRR01004636.1~~GHRR01004636.1.p1  ORF type:complete len:115 (+),score=16.54 GHRR01004636.1:42-347(+)
MDRPTIQMWKGVQISGECSFRYTHFIQLLQQPYSADGAIWSPSDLEHNGAMIACCRATSSPVDVQQGSVGALLGQAQRARRFTCNQLSKAHALCSQDARLL